MDAGKLGGMYEVERNKVGKISHGHTGGSNFCPCKNWVCETTKITQHMKAKLVNATPVLTYIDDTRGKIIAVLSGAGMGIVCSAIVIFVPMVIPH